MNWKIKYLFCHELVKSPHEGLCDLGIWYTAHNICQECL
jgi:hypothetical protein